MVEEFLTGRVMSSNCFEFIKCSRSISVALTLCLDAQPITLKRCFVYGFPRRLRLAHAYIAFPCWVVWLAINKRRCVGVRVVEVKSTRWITARVNYFGLLNFGQQTNSSIIVRFRSTTAKNTPWNCPRRINAQTEHFAQNGFTYWLSSHIDVADMQRQEELVATTSLTFKKCCIVWRTIKLFAIYCKQIHVLNCVSLEYWNDAAILVQNPFAGVPSGNVNVPPSLRLSGPCRSGLLNYSGVDNEHEHEYEPHRKTKGPDHWSQNTTIKCPLSVHINYNFIGVFFLYQKCVKCSKKKLANPVDRRSYAKQLNYFAHITFIV